MYINNLLLLVFLTLTAPIFASEYIFPLPPQGVSQEGENIYWRAKTYAGHCSYNPDRYAVDLTLTGCNAEGQEIVSSSGGHVLEVRNHRPVNYVTDSPDYGNFVKICASGYDLDAGSCSGLVFFYAHMRIVSDDITVGIQVIQGQPLGEVGHTGYTIGKLLDNGSYACPDYPGRNPHLHLAVRSISNGVRIPQQIPYDEVDLTGYLDGSDNATNGIDYVFNIVNGGACVAAGSGGDDGDELYAQKFIPPDELCIIGVDNIEAGCPSNNTARPMVPGTIFTKKFIFENIGTETWTETVCLTFNPREDAQAESLLLTENVCLTCDDSQIPCEVSSGEQATFIASDLTAPTVEQVDGEYEEWWSLQETGEDPPISITTSDGVSTLISIYSAEFVSTQFIDGSENPTQGDSFTKRVTLRNEATTWDERVCLEFVENSDNSQQSLHTTGSVCVQCDVEPCVNRNTDYPFDIPMTAPDDMVGEYTEVWALKIGDLTILNDVQNINITIDIQEPEEPEASLEFAYTAGNLMLRPREDEFPDFARPITFLSPEGQICAVIPSSEHETWTESEIVLNLANIRSYFDAGQDGHSCLEEIVISDESRLIFKPLQFYIGDAQNTLHNFPFRDVSPADDHAMDIVALWNFEVVNGYTDPTKDTYGMFGYAGEQYTLKRIEFLKMALLAWAGGKSGWNAKEGDEFNNNTMPIDPATGSPYPDTSSISDNDWSWSWAYVNFGISSSIMRGEGTVPPRKFAPNRAIQRAELMKVLLKTYCLDELTSSLCLSIEENANSDLVSTCSSSFSDVPNGSDNTNALAWACDFIEGSRHDTSPEFSSSEYDLFLESFVGTDNEGGDTFSPIKDVMRTEMAQLTCLLLEMKLEIDVDHNRLCDSEPH